MNAMTEMKPAAATIPSLAMERSHLIQVLGASLYPGAKLASIEAVIDYCIAAQLDPLQKPVHIVPMKVKTGRQNSYGDDETEWRDVIMPGVGLYRIQAARTGTYVGMSEPEFGPIVDMPYTEEYWENRKKHQRKATLSYPLWCKVTVRRAVAGVIAEFTALEYWMENAATKANGEPNSMWIKRAFGQIAKCAEAQALRKGFPEVGSMPTMEEMEGRNLVDINDLQTVEGNTPTEESLTPQRKSAAAAAALTESQPATVPMETATEKVAAQAEARTIDVEVKEVPEAKPAAAPAKEEPKPAAAPAKQEPAAAGPVLTEGMQATIRARLEKTGKTEAQFQAQFGTTLAAAPKAQVNAYIKWAEA